MDIRNSTVRRVLINDRKAIEILSNDVLKKMGLKDQDLKPAKLIYGFDKKKSTLKEG